MEIKLVTREEANQIFDTREPMGLFYEIDGDSYIGIDNSTGDAWVEEFKTKEECFRWLKPEPIVIKKDGQGDLVLPVVVRG